MILILILILILLFVWRRSYKGSYGYSIWYVPIQRQKSWIFSHIPHITVQSGFHSIEEAIRASRRFPQRIQVRPTNELEWYGLPGDPLPGWGLRVDVPYGSRTDYDPHITISYDTQKPKNISLFSPFVAKMVIADTRSYRPEEWKIV